MFFCLGGLLGEFRFLLGLVRGVPEKKLLETGEGDAATEVDTAATEVNYQDLFVFSQDIAHEHS